MEIPVVGAEPRGTALRRVVVWQTGAGSNVSVSVFAANYQRFSLLDPATGIRIKMGAPVRRPLSAVPLIETIAMFVRNNSVVPMMIDIDVIEADVIVMVMVVAMAAIVVMVVTPSPSIWTPPGLTPSSEPEAVTKSEAKADVPIIGKARAKPIGAWTADPIASDIGRVIIARAVNYHVVWTHLCPKVARSIAGVHHIRG